MTCSDPLGWVMSSRPNRMQPCAQQFLGNTSDEHRWSIDDRSRFAGGRNRLCSPRKQGTPERVPGQRQRSPSRVVSEERPRQPAITDWRADPAVSRLRCRPFRCPYCPRAVHPSLVGCGARGACSHNQTPSVGCPPNSSGFSCWARQHTSLRVDVDFDGSLNSVVFFAPG
jgi:hypothetical protein